MSGLARPWPGPSRGDDRRTPDGASSADGKARALPSPLRVALLSSDYAADGPVGRGGGIETYVRLMARGLADAGHDVHVVTPAVRRTRTVIDGGVHVHAIEIPDEWQGRAPDLAESRAALSFAWHARRKVRALMTSHGVFDAVEVPEYKAQGYFLAKDSDVPLVVKCHAHLLLCLSLNGIDLTRDTALLADLERETLHATPAITVNSKALAERCAADYRVPIDRFTHVPYGIDTHTFSPTPSGLRAQLGLAGAPVALFVGRLEERKGVTTLVDAFADVVREVPDAVLVLAGPDVLGPPANHSNEAWMRERWSAMGVPAESYRFLGPQAHGALPVLYSSADLMVAPSWYEAFGLVYLEAMACGCPPIGCRAGGAAEVVRDGETGVLVPPGDARALARAMVRLLRSPETRAQLGAHGRAVVERDYTLSAMVARTERFYREEAGS